MISSDIKPGVLLTWNAWAMSIDHGIRKPGETHLVLERNGFPSNYWRTLDSRGRVINRREKDIVKYMEVVSGS